MRGAQFLAPRKRIFLFRLKTCPLTVLAPSLGEVATHINTKKLFSSLWHHQAAPLLCTIPAFLPPTNNPQQSVVPNNHVIPQYGLGGPIRRPTTPTRYFPARSLRRLSGAHASLPGLFASPRRRPPQVPKPVQSLLRMPHGTSTHGARRFTEFGVQPPGRRGRRVRQGQGKGRLCRGQTHCQGIQMVVAKVG